MVLAAGTLFLSFDLIDNRRIVLTSLVCASRLELAAFLFYRVLKRGKDSRFDAVRERCLVFLVFWVWQMLWVFVVSTPVIYVNAVTLVEVPPIGALDWVGWALVVVGCVLQTVADLHKNAFRSDPANNKKVCDRGLWKYSRHPNFFGEVIIWWGVFIAGIPVFVESPAGFATVVSPVFTMFVLLGFTGIPQAEGKASARWYDGGESEAQYVEYFRSTPPLMMCRPRSTAPCRSRSSGCSASSSRATSTRPRTRTRRPRTWPMARCARARAQFCSYKARLRTSQRIGEHAHARARDCETATRTRSVVGKGAALQLQACADAGGVDIIDHAGGITGRSRVRAACGGLGIDRKSSSLGFSTASSTCGIDSKSSASASAREVTRPRRASLHSYTAACQPEAARVGRKEEARAIMLASLLAVLDIASLSAPKRERR